MTLEDLANGLASSASPAPIIPKQLHLPESVQLRNSTPHDEVFLERLYYSTREDLQALGPAAEPLVRMQYRAKTQGYRQQYPQASTYVIEKHHQAIGQMVLNVAPSEIRMIELAFLPEQRRRGWGKAVMRAIQHHAAHLSSTIVLTVGQDNHAAKSLYSALGFRTYATEPPHERMQWLPEADS